MPPLLGTANRTSSAPNALGINTEEQSPPTKAASVAGVAKRATVMTRASGFFHKLRPNLTIDTATTPVPVSRRFSFEPGDDVANQRTATPGMVILPDGSRTLRKSASLCSISSHTPSRIPTPVYTAGALARPRRERDESSSSLLTVIKRSDNGSSRTSSVYSSPSVREDFFKTSPCRDRDSMSSGLRSRQSNRLLDHTNDLRGNGSRDIGLDGKRSSACTVLSDHQSVPERIVAHQENCRPKVD